MATTSSPSTPAYPDPVRCLTSSPTLDLREIFRHRDLLLTLADRDIRVRYKQTVLGVVWVCSNP